MWLRIVWRPFARNIWKKKERSSASMTSVGPGIFGTIPRVPVENSSSGKSQEEGGQGMRKREVQISIGKKNGAKSGSEKTEERKFIFQEMNSPLLSLKENAEFIGEAFGSMQKLGDDVGVNSPRKKM
jgi:hypothetical protein